MRFTPTTAEYPRDKTLKPETCHGTDTTTFPSQPTTRALLPRPLAVTPNFAPAKSLHLAPRAAFFSV